MGATNNIKETNISLKLADLECPNCSQKFTEQEITDRNFDIWFDTTNDVKLIPVSEVKETNLYFPLGRTGYELTIWIRSIEHEDCPTVMKCENCYGKFLEEKMKADNEWGMSYYCPPCWKEERNKETKHE